MAKDKDKPEPPKPAPPSGPPVKLPTAEYTGAKAEDGLPPPGRDVPPPASGAPAPLPASGKPVAFDTSEPLTPVGQDSDGKFKPLDKLDYPPEPGPGIAGPGMNIPEPWKGDSPFPEPMQRAPHVVFVQSVQDFATAANAKDWAGAFRAGGCAVASFCDTMDAGGPEKAEALETTEDSYKALDRFVTGLRNSVPQTLGARRIKWHGGDPHPMSGSPAPLAAVPASAPGAIDPNALLVLFELVAKLWSMFREKAPV